jgi:hypothetical protein
MLLIDRELEGRRDPMRFPCRPTHGRAGRAWAAVAVCVATCLLGPAARAQSGLPVRSSETAFMNMDFPAAATFAKQAIAGGGLSHSQLVRLTFIMASSYATLEEEELARDAFVSLVGMAPEYNLDRGASPKLQGPFKEARGVWRARGAKPQLDAVLSARANEPVRARIRLSDPLGKVSRIVVHWSYGASTPKVRELPARPVSTVDLNVGPLGSGNANVWITAQDDHNSEYLVFGTEEAPVAVRVDAAPAPTKAKEEEGGTVLSSPLFWVFVGAVVAGGTTAVVLGTKRTEEVPGAPSAAALSGSLQCNGAVCR